ncbi:NADH-quinone oxidoreductase subunit C [Brevundimonas sp.]|uniref:NADH-quinone oxidoreductase subunit C n=1 Tax=Brevundimonas sp. TaxID=1871086 RepID=UPI0025CD4B75|nr:NADH-quinone oxidoreductase subunit C [Brevundimonas sp.]
MSAPSKKALAALAKGAGKACGKALVDTKIAFGEVTLTVQRTQIVPVLGALKAMGFQQLVDLCGADYPARAERFEVIYHLLSLTRNERIRIKVKTDEQQPVPTAIPVYPNAEWFEREAYDMYGMWFDGHPDLRRLLTDYGFEGHPLRKDFPMTGYVEVRYDEEQRRVVYEPVKLNQEFRQFDFLSPWEGAEYARWSGVLPGDEKAGT